MRLTAPVLLLIGASIGASISASAQAGSQIGLPVLFVHGICDSADNLLPTEAAVESAVQARFPTLYPAGSPMVAFYNGANVAFQIPGAQVIDGVPNPPVATVDPATRFFLVALDDPGVADYQDFDPSSVANVPIYIKGNELANVIWKIKAITGAPRVIVIAHSMGGLVARAYLEHVASAMGTANTAVPYGNDVAALITLDTPHGGAEITGISLLDPFPWLSCIANSSVDKSEMEPTSATIAQLDYETGGAGDLPAGTTITSIASYWAGDVLGLIAIPGSDDVIKARTQDLASSLYLPAVHSQSVLAARNNEFHSTFTTPSSDPLICGDDDLLHLLSCTGDAPQTFAYLSGAVVPAAVAYPNHIAITPGVWSLPTGKQATFHATTPVLWSVLEGAEGGQISASGIYTAPKTVAGGSQVFHIVAMDATNPAKFGEAAVTVTAP